MWSQYGDNYYGMCLVFSKNELEKTILSQCSRDNYRCGFVKYSQNSGISPTAVNLDGNRITIEGTRKYAINHILDNYEDLLLTKDIDYRDEAEYRFIIYDPEQKMEYVDISMSIRAVIVGDRTPEVYFPLINDQCSILGIFSRRAYWAKNGMHLLLLEPKTYDKESHPTSR